MTRLKGALIGIGGFGRVHVDCLKELACESLVEIVAFADPNNNLPAAQDLLHLGARGYTNCDDLFKEEKHLDFVTIATPIPTHVPIASKAFQKGLHVFLEKPPAVRIQDFRRLVEQAHVTNSLCVVNFGDVARSEIRTLKERIITGALGRIRSIHAVALWRRTDKYYTRASWAGRLTLHGEYVLDGPMNNSCAHLLNLAAFLCGNTVESFARPLWVRGELYRAAAIESEDTDCLLARMDSGIDVCIHLTQAAERSLSRKVIVKATQGDATYLDDTGVTFSDGETVPPGILNPTSLLLREFLKAIESSNMPTMSLQNCESFLLLSNGAYESARFINQIPDEYVEEVLGEDGLGWHVKNIENTMTNLCLEGKLLSDGEVPWAFRTEIFDLKEYASFPIQWSVNNVKGYK